MLSSDLHIHTVACEHTNAEGKRRGGCTCTQIEIKVSLLKKESIGGRIMVIKGRLNKCNVYCKGMKEIEIPCKIVTK